MGSPREIGYRVYEYTKSITYLTGFIKAFKIVATDGDIEFWATSHLMMNELFRLKYAKISKA
jgi:hypothetical protein